MIFFHFPEGRNNLIGLWDKDRFHLDLFWLFLKHHWNDNEVCKPQMAAAAVAGADLRILL